MIKSLTVSEAKPKLGSLLDQASKGRTIYLRRKNRLFRIEPVEQPEPIPVRAVGYFDFSESDDLVKLANRASPSLVSSDEN